MAARSTSAASRTAQRVRHVFVGQIRVGAAWSTRAAIASAVEGDDPVVPGQRGDLALPESTMHDRPRRKQQHAGAVFVAEDLVGGLDPLSNDCPFSVWLSCSQLQPPISLPLAGE